MLINWKNFLPPLNISPLNLNHWIDEISNFRYELDLRLTSNLRKYLENKLDKCYANACKLNYKQPNSHFTLPEKCPYTLEQILDIDWLPSFR